MDSSILCLSVLLFMEARGEPLHGQYAVLETVHNRSKHPKFPNTYCGVIKQKSQFSFYKGSISPPKYELDAWKKSVEVAKNFSKNKTNYTNGSIYFNHKRLGVRYKTNVRVTKIGSHVFY